MFGAILEAYFKIFLIRKYNTIVSIFYMLKTYKNWNDRKLYKKNFLLYLIQFYIGFLSQSRHLQIIAQYARGSVPN